MPRIYKIVPRQAWEAALQTGQFIGAGVDLTDGFIHFSTAAQAQETGRRYFSGQTGLVALGIDPGRLGAALKWEPSRGGDLFAHLYEPLDCALVDWVGDVALAPDGTPQLQGLVP